MFPRFDKLTAADFAQNIRLLDDAGFADSPGSLRRLMHLRGISGGGNSPDSENSQLVTPFWYKTLGRILLEAPDPGAVVAAVDQFVSNASSAAAAFRLFEETPRSLEIMARLSCGSSFLTQALLSQPEALWELTIQRRTAEMKSREDFRDQAREALIAANSTDEKLLALRRFQRRELLRIGMCDAFGLLDLKFVTLQISLLADAVVQVCLDIACDQAGITTAPFSVLALGKHGGEELNYSSDIDLILIASADSVMAQKVARYMIDGLSRNMACGFLYRVDMRLRPWGDAGPLVSTPDAFEHYLKKHAELWEKQALLKVRVVAGCSSIGQELLSRLPPLLFTSTESEVLNNVRHMKATIEDRLRRRGKLNSEVKLGQGSIRDVEFLTQALQLIHGQQEPRLASPNTLDALVRLAEFGVIDTIEYRQLREGYVFLRTIEHALQLAHNQQTHELPASPAQREWLARRLDYPSESVLLARFHEHRQSVRRIFDRYFHRPEPDGSSSVPIADFSAPNADSPPVSARRRLSGYVSELESLRSLLRADYGEFGAEQQCDVQTMAVPGSSVEQLIVVTGPETPGLLSMICSLFFANHLDIREGDAVVGPATSRLGHVVASRRFVGVFLVQQTTSDAASSSSLKQPTSRPSGHQVIRSELNRMLSDLQSGGRDNVRRCMLEMFCQRVRELPPNAAPRAELTLEIPQTGPDEVTQLNISADDSFGFFFELSNALSICGFRIRRAELGSDHGRIEDSVYVTESDGQPVRRRERLEELRTAVTLIKQFTHWLPSNNDPHHSLIRFRDLLQSQLAGTNGRNRVASLGQPKVLRAISRVLGMSRYLWEDFLQAKPDDVLPMLTNAEQLESRIQRHSLEQELRSLLTHPTHVGNSGSGSDQAAAPSQGLSVSRSRIDVAAVQVNAFKDRHLFRIDLRHVLGHCGPFGAFSEEVTELAEVTVEAAFLQARRELMAVHGLPRTASGSECSFTLAGLGKFGGVEMGFASDIELFLIYEQDCRTDGRDSISGTNFFERLVSRATRLVESRRRGIFEIDLRIRPYGQAGPAAVSLETFQRYYAADGPAWPYERQSLVKLRCVGGDPVFAKTVQNASHTVVYTGAAFDFSAMRAMRERQIRQLVRAGTVNAKLSDGGLVDCEYAVQALQISMGHRIPALKVPNTMKALNAAREAGIITSTDYAASIRAYIFLRQLIDCLRMVRGNAEDLTVPVSGSPLWIQLARRLKAVHEASLPLDELESEMTVVRWFSQHVEQICTLRLEEQGLSP